MSTIKNDQILLYCHFNKIVNDNHKIYFKIFFHVREWYKTIN